MRRGVSDDAHKAEPRMAGMQRLPVQSKASQRRGTKRCQQQIGFFQQSIQLFFFGGIFQVEPKHVLSLTELGIPLRREFAGGVAIRWLDLGDLSAKLREPRRSHGAGGVQRQAHDLYFTQERRIFSRVHYEYRNLSRDTARAEETSPSRVVESARSSEKTHAKTVPVDRFMDVHWHCGSECHGAATQHRLSRPPRGAGQVA